MSVPMIAMTTKSSTSVNALWRPPLRVNDHGQFSRCNCGKIWFVLCIGFDCKRRLAVRLPTAMH